VRSITVLLAVPLIAGCGTQTSTSTQTSTVTKTAAPSPLVLVPDQGGDLVYQPDEIGVGASNVIRNIRWANYGSALAIGHGLYSVENCVPNCAGGTITWVPVTIRLKQRILCKGRLAYLLMAVKGDGVDNQFDTVASTIGATREAC